MRFTVLETALLCLGKSRGGKWEGEEARTLTHCRKEADVGGRISKQLTSKVDVASPYWLFTTGLT